MIKINYINSTAFGAITLFAKLFFNVQKYDTEFVFELRNSIYNPIYYKTIGNGDRLANLIEIQKYIYFKQYEC